MRSFLAVAFLGLASGLHAEARACAVDRTAIGMAGHTLCLLSSAMPAIQRREDGSVASLVWSHPERFPPEVQLPPGTFYLIVDSYPSVPARLLAPAPEVTQPSDLPQMRETLYGLVTVRGIVSHRFLPQQARLNDQAFVLDCNDAIAPQRQGLGGHDCELKSQFLPGLWIKVFLGTVDWGHAPAWPRLDATWAETWPPYLANLESGLRSLLSVQHQGKLGAPSPMGVGWVKPTNRWIGGHPQTRANTPWARPGFPTPALGQSLSPS